MNKTELIAAVAEAAEVSKKDSEKVLKAFVDVVTEELKSEGIMARTAVSFLQGDSLVSCSNKPLSRAGIALDPIVFGVEQDQRQIELQAYVLFPDRKSVV